MHYLFSNVKSLLVKQDRNEEEFYGSLGLSHEMIFNLVTGAGIPTPEQLILIADALAISVDDILRKNLSMLPNSGEKFKMLVTDVDGVMTDGGMYYSDSGFELKKYNAKDGLAMMRLEKNGIRTGMLSHGFNRPLIRNRAEMLSVSFSYTGQEKKAVIIEQWAEKAGVALEEIAYIGDDVNDLDVMHKVGFTAAPADASRGVRKEVDVVLTKKGGEGCVRELAELLFPQYFNV
jgi:3-deoxy-D-manno-octulosonate 8-phosphate phosphatase (KDO 8-P phosphatase)